MRSALNPQALVLSLSLLAWPQVLSAPDELPPRWPEQELERISEAALAGYEIDQEPLWSVVSEPNALPDHEPELRQLLERCEALEARCRALRDEYPDSATHLALWLEARGRTDRAANLCLAAQVQPLEAAMQPLLPLDNEAEGFLASAAEHVDAALERCARRRLVPRPENRPEIDEAGQLDAAIEDLEVLRQ